MDGSFSEYSNLYLTVDIKISVFFICPKYCRTIKINLCGNDDGFEGKGILKFLLLQDFFL